MGCTGGAGATRPWREFQVKRRGLARLRLNIAYFAGGRTSASVSEAKKRGRILSPTRNTVGVLPWDFRETRMHAVVRSLALAAVACIAGSFHTFEVLAAGDTARDAPQCLQYGDRAARQSRKYEGFRPDPRAGARQQRTNGKFSPRYPVDVDTVVKIPGETRRVVDSGQWTEAELWCGFHKGRLVGTDMIVKNDKIRMPPDKKSTQSAMVSR